MGRLTLTNEEIALLQQLLDTVQLTGTPEALLIMLGRLERIQAKLVDAADPPHLMRSENNQRAILPTPRSRTGQLKFSDSREGEL